MTTALSYDALRALPVRHMAMGLAMSWQAAQDPDRPALTMGDKTLSRMDIDRICNRMARAYAALGIGKDDRVVVIMPTGPRHQIAAYGAWKLGASVVPLSPKLVDAELTKLIEQVDPALVVGLDPERLPGRKVLPADFEPDASLSDEPLPEAIATRWKGITSGGSTGMPKLMWDNFSSVVDPHGPLEILVIKPEDRMLHPAGAYHNAPFSQTNWGLSWGCHVVLMERFDPVEWLKAVEKHKIRWAYLVPTMMSRILSVPKEVREGYDLSSLEVVIHMEQQVDGPNRICRGGNLLPVSHLLKVNHRRASGKHPPVNRVGQRLSLGKVEPRPWWHQVCGLLTLGQSRQSKSAKIQYRVRTHLHRWNGS